jgi:hypothetical protein
MVLVRTSKFIAIRRKLISGAAAAALLIGWVGPSFAAEATIDDAVAGLAPMSAAELSDQRGGFSIGPAKVSFGFTVVTSISGGQLGPGVTVTTNFTIDSPGALQNLGTVVTSNVNSAIDDAGATNDGKLSTTLPAGASNVAAGSDPALPTPSIPGPAILGAPIISDPQVAALANASPVADGIAGSTPANSPASGGATGPANLASATVPFEVQFDPEKGTVSLTAGPDTSVILQYVQGQLTKIENSNNDVQIEHHYSASYVIENYQDIAASAEMHTQLSNLTNQLLALDALGRF